jgi:hypothetical protein
LNSQALFPLSSVDGQRLLFTSKEVSHSLLDMQKRYGIPYRILCKGTWQKSLEARPGLGLSFSHFTPLDKIQFGVRYGACNPASVSEFEEKIY